MNATLDLYGIKWSSWWEHWFENVLSYHTILWTQKKTANFLYSQVKSVLHEKFVPSWFNFDMICIFIRSREKLSHLISGWAVLPIIATISMLTNSTTKFKKLERPRTNDALKSQPIKWKHNPSSLCKPTNACTPDQGHKSQMKHLHQTCPHLEARWLLNCELSALKPTARFIAPHRRVLPLGALSLAQLHNQCSNCPYYSFCSFVGKYACMYLHLAHM